MIRSLGNRIFQLRHPLSLPRISEDGRAGEGCSYQSFARASCLGRVAGRRLEPGAEGGSAQG